MLLRSTYQWGVSCCGGPVSIGLKSQRWLADSSSISLSAVFLSTMVVLVAIFVLYSRVIAPAACADFPDLDERTFRRQLLQDFTEHFGGNHCNMLASISAAITAAVQRVSRRLSMQFSSELFGGNLHSIPASISATITAAFQQAFRRQFTQHFSEHFGGSY